MLFLLLLLLPRHVFACVRPPGGHLVQQQQHPAGASSTPAAMPRGSALQQPLNTEDWMFDIGRSTNSTAAALNAPRASSTSAACAGSSSSLRASSSRLPMHPGQLSPAEAQAAAAAAATRLAQVDAAAAAAAARSAAAAAAAATRGSRGASEAEPAGGPAGSAGRPGDMWDHLAQVRGVTITVMVTQHVWVVVGPHHGWKGPTYGCGDQEVCRIL